MQTSTTLGLDITFRYHKHNTNQSFCCVDVKLMQHIPRVERLPPSVEALGVADHQTIMLFDFVDGGVQCALDCKVRSDSWIGVVELL